MPNNYYERQSEMNPGELADGLAMQQEFDAISRGFAKLPKPHRDGNGFEGPTRVGDPVEKTDALNLGSIEKLNIIFYRNKITSEDWNSITDEGIYDVVSASGNNKAPTHNYGLLQVYSFNGVVSQIYYPDVSNPCVIAKRTCLNILLSTWQEWLLVSKTEPSVCLVNAIGTGAPNEKVTDKLPFNITINSRYVITNPFGNSPIKADAQIFINGIWSDTGFVFDTSSAGGYGTKASYAQDSQGNAIILQTGSKGLVAAYASQGGGGHGNSNAGALSAPCRIFVSKLER